MEWNLLVLTVVISLEDVDKLLCMYIVAAHTRVVDLQQRVNSLHGEINWPGKPKQNS